MYIVVREKPVRVRSVEPLDGFRVKIGFTDGTERILDLEKRLWGPIFESIRKDLGLFRQVRVEHGTIAWPNGADLCPDVLYYDGPPPWAEKRLKKAARS